MKGFRLFGDYVFEYIIITLLLTVSLLLVIPFVPVYTGVIAYLKHKREDRMLKDIFICIKDNIKILIPFTLFEALIMVFSILNIYFFKNHKEGFNMVILVLSYIILIFGVIFLAHAPKIIIGMNVNLFQLLYNCFLFFFGGIVNSFIAIIAIGAVVVVAGFIPYIVPFLLYFVAVIIEKLTDKNFYYFKARKQNMTSAQLKDKEKKEQEDF